MRGLKFIIGKRLNPQVVPNYVYASILKYIFYKMDAIKLRIVIIFLYITKIMEILKFILQTYMLFSLFL